MDANKVITIDGPAGAGKSTLSKRLAAALGWRRLDTGALYRAVAVAARERGLGAADSEAVGRMAENLKMELIAGDEDDLVILDGRDVTGLLRSEAISALSSELSIIPMVRAALMPHQRRQAETGPLVAEGRDMGTVVFPEARLKFFLKADLSVRAGRRLLQLRREGASPDPRTVEREMAARDATDCSRDLAPLRAAPEAVVIDASYMTLERVESFMLAEAVALYGRV
jgi:cytidylate kinase